MMDNYTPPVYDVLVEGCILIQSAFTSPVLDAAIGIIDGRFVFVGKQKDLPPGAGAKQRLRAYGHVALPGLVNVHTHTILSMVRGVAEDMGFAPAYTPGVPQGHMVTEEEAVALARLGALEAMLFGSTLINDTYVHTQLTLPAMAELGLRVFSCNRIHDVDFSGVSQGKWEYDAAIGEKTLAEAEALVQRFHGRPDARTGVQLAAHAPDTCSTPFLRPLAMHRDAWAYRCKPIWRKARSRSHASVRGMARRPQNFSMRSGCWMIAWSQPIASI
jgi:5-methylthioadenosine/S-adenosylhomocysteine deaminase